MSQIPLFLCLLLAQWLGYSEPRARPLVIALGAMVLMGAPSEGQWPRLDAWAWCAWPGISAALSWWTWRGSWKTIASTFAGHALLLMLAPGGWWPEHPEAWAVASRAPFLVGPLLSLLAWTSRQRSPFGLAPIAAALAWSACLDVAFGLVALPLSAWWAPRVANAVTFTVIGAMLLRWARRTRSRS